MQKVRPMKNRYAFSLVAALALSATLSIPLAAQAQNIAIVNGKAVPKARVDALMAQVSKQAAARGQQLPPDVDKLVRDKVVLDEMFVQEAEKRGLAASPDYKAQMELARQNILVQALLADYEKKNPISDAEVKAEYDKFKAQASGTEYRARHILVEKEDEAKALIAQIKAGAKFEDLAKKNSKDPGSGENGGDLDFAAPNAYVPEFSQAMVKLKKGEMTEDAGEDAVRLPHHQARGHARGAVPGARRRQAADPAAARPAEGRRVPRRDPGQGQDRLQVLELIGPSRPQAVAPQATTVSDSTRPASIRSCRSQRAAMPASCVTSTSVVPASRLSSNISSITVSPVAKSRLPVGSSASRTSGLDDEGARQRDALLLAARQHLRVVAQPLAEADAAEHLGGQPPRVGLALQLERQHDVLERVQVAEQLETLEHEAHLGGAHRGTRVFVEREQVDAVEPDRPAGRRVEAGDDRQQRALAGARRADDGGRLVRREREIDLMENGQRPGGIANLLGQALDDDDGFRHE